MGYIPQKGGSKTGVMVSNLANQKMIHETSGKNNMLPKTKLEKKGPGRIIDVGEGTNKISNRGSKS